MHLEYIAMEPVLYSHQECVNVCVSVKSFSFTQHIPMKLFKDNDTELNTTFSTSYFLQQSVCNHQHYSYVVIISKIINRQICPLINTSFFYDSLNCGQFMFTQPMVYTFSFSTNNIVPHFWVGYNFHINYNESAPEDKIYLSIAYEHEFTTFVHEHPMCFILRNGKDVDIHTTTSSAYLAVYKYSNAPLMIQFSSISFISMPAVQTTCNAEFNFCQQYVSIHKMRMTFLHCIT